MNSAFIIMQTLAAQAILTIAKYFSIEWSVCLSHSCPLYKLLDEFRILDAI